MEAVNIQVSGRVEKAVQILSRTRSEGRDIYQVRSQTRKGVVYTVDLRGPSCTCADWQFRKINCKHILACKIKRAKQK